MARERRTPQPLESTPGYHYQVLRPGERMPALPTAEVIAQYDSRRLPEAGPKYIFATSRLQRRSLAAEKLTSHVLPDHSLLEVTPEPLWTFPRVGGKNPTLETGLGLRGRQEQEQEAMRWTLYREANRERAREINEEQLDAYKTHAAQVVRENPRSAEAVAIGIARLINGVADGDPEQVGNLLGLLKQTAGKMNPLLLETLKVLGSGISIRVPKVPLLPEVSAVAVPGIPALRELAVLTDNVPDSPATESAAMGMIQRALQAGRDAVIAGQPDRIMHEEELRAHPEDHQAELVTRRAVKVAAALAPFAITYGAAVILPPVEGTVARIAESVIAKKVGQRVFDTLKGRSTEIVDIVGSIISDRWHGSKTHTREAIAIMALILDIAGVNVNDIKDTLDAHMYAQWALSHREEFYVANEPVVLHQPYIEALKLDRQAMGEVMQGRYNQARRLAGLH